MTEAHARGGQGHSKASARGTRAASTPRPALPPLQAAVCLSADGPSPGRRGEASTRAQPPVHPPSASEHRILFFFFSRYNLKNPSSGHTLILNPVILNYGWF